MYSPLHTSFNFIFSTSKTFECHTRDLSDPAEWNRFSHSPGAADGASFGKALSLYLGGEHQSNASLSVSADGSDSGAGNDLGAVSSWEPQAGGSCFSENVLSTEGGVQYASRSAELFSRGKRTFLRDARLSSVEVQFSSEYGRSSASVNLFSSDVQRSLDGALNHASNGGHQLSVIEADRGARAWVSGPLARGPTQRTRLHG